MRDLANNLGVEAAIVPAVQAATIESDPIDLLGFGSAMVIINTGAIASAGLFVPTIEESDSDIESPDPFEPVAAADLVGALPDALAASSVVKVGYVGNKRFIRVVLTKSGGTSIAAGAIVVKGNAQNKPVA